MNIHYLEVVTPDVDAVCATYQQLYNCTFSEPVALLGGARTAPLPNGGQVGVRAPMHDAEEPETRTYVLVDNIERALNEAVQLGADVAHPPLELAGLGQFAIYRLGSLMHGLWQR
ncbi:MAG: hydroxylase [Pseudomonadota bacterium]